MTAVHASDCVGVWRRTLLVSPDGSRDDGIDVVWLQGLTAFVDSRGFAGRLRQHGDVFEWCRDVDLEPGPHPDEGSMRWDGPVLVESGVHENYTERWIREQATTPAGAMFVSTDDGSAGLLVRVGRQFGWAEPTAVVIGAVGSPEWNRLSPKRREDELIVNGKSWTVTDIEGTVNL
jgi:hypothetical protein